MLGYYDFPICKLAFATGQKDARPFEVQGSYFRLRGRKHNHWTLLSFTDAELALDILGAYASCGDKIQSVNYTSPRPPAFTKDGPIEWSTAGARTRHLFLEEQSGWPSKRVRRAFRAVSSTSMNPPLREVMDVFNRWREWAKNRHFMVFTGHYLSWINLHYQTNQATTRLIGMKVDDQLEGIFGWEVHRGIAQITIAKHTQKLQAFDLWINGLTAIGDMPVLCGSTADELKRNLWLSPNKSWAWDTKAILTRYRGL